MKLCVFSDIHGNAPAFKAALPRLLEENADAYVCLGDVCGYYFDFAEVYKALKQIPRLTVLKGNHEQMFLEIIEGNQQMRSQYLDRYGPSLERCLDNLDNDTQEWIKGLPEKYFISVEGAAFFHANPLTPLEGYVYPDSSLTSFEHLPYRLVCLGHTHYRMVRRQGQTLFVNPGSLGQPRDGQRPSYAMIDTQTLEIVFKDIHFDVESFIARVRQQAGDHAKLYQVLERIPRDG